MPESPDNKTATTETIQWMHFAAVRAGLSLEEVEQTIDGKRGILGKRLRDALTDLFTSGDESEILEHELLVFDAKDEYAWINPHSFYFIPAVEVTAELRFPAGRVWKALVGALIMARQEEAGSWFSLAPGKKNFALLASSQAYQSDTGDLLFRVLELLVRGVPDHDAGGEEEDLERLLAASKGDDKEAAEKLEALAWRLGDANLWRFAMAVVDGKTYLAKMFEERLDI